MNNIIEKNNLWLDLCGKVNHWHNTHGTVFWLNDFSLLVFTIKKYY